MHMSKSAIFDQLTSEHGEKFSVESAQYAMDNLEFDWNANALKKAESYSEDYAHVKTREFMISLFPNMVKNLLKKKHSTQSTM